MQPVRFFVGEGWHLPVEALITLGCVDSRLKTRHAARSEASREHQLLSGSTRDASLRAA